MECLAVKIVQSESRHFFRDKICRRQIVIVFPVFVVLREKIYFKIWRPSDVGKSEKEPVQKESNCNDVCKVCQVNIKVTYGKSVVIKACGNIFKPSARKQIRSWQMRLFPQLIGKTAKRSLFRKIVQWPSFALLLAQIWYHFLPKIVAFPIELVENDLLIFIRLVEYKYAKTFVVLNDRSLTSQKDGLSISLNLTN